MFQLRRFSLGIFVSFMIALSANTSAHGQVGQSQLVNPDLASEKDLLALPHMNAAVVKSILEQRPFLKMADLHALLSKTLSKEQLADLYGKMFVQVNVNTASDEEILLIPGAGSRMTREFRDKPKKWRAWNSMFSCRSILTAPAMTTFCRFPAPAGAWCASLKNTAPGLPSNSSAKRSASTSTRKKWRGWKSTSRSTERRFAPIG
jgi:hypothetical protein